MRKFIFWLSLIFTITSFSNGFDVKIGTDYSNIFLNNQRTNIFGIFIQGEYNQEAYRVSDNLHIETSLGLDLGLGFGKYMLNRDLFDSEAYLLLSKKVNSMNNLINNYSYKKAQIKDELKDVVIKENLLGHLNTHFNDENSVDRIKTIIKGLNLLDTATLNNSNRLNEEAEYKKNKSINTTLINLNGFIVRKLVYKINNNLKISAGLKLGIGYEVAIYKSKRNNTLISNLKNLKTNYIEIIDENENNARAKAVELFNKLNEGKFKNENFKNNDIIISKFSNSNRNEFVAALTEKAYTKLKNKTPIKIPLTHSFTIPFAVVFDANYKNILGSLELFGKYKYVVSENNQSALDGGFKFSLGFAF